MPDRIDTRDEFAAELTLLREQAGLTVRQVANAVGGLAAHSTLGDWYAGRGLPATGSRDLLISVLNACGVDDREQVEQWLVAWRRVRRAPGRRPAGPEPYRGLAGYEPEDAEWFFGRAVLTERLVGRLSELHAAGGGVQVVVGASGSGKSSLLRAGLIPSLRAGALPGSANWPVVLFSPGAKPADALEHHVAGFASTAGMPGSPEWRRLVIVVDQFEELFTACTDERDRRAFIVALCTATSGQDGALVVIGLRADFFGHALRHTELVDAVQTGQLAVGPMTDAELRQVIVEPARKARVDLEDGLVELLLRDVAPVGVGTGTAPNDVAALPLLSHALYTTWRQGRGRRLTIRDYRAVGGISGAVAASATAVYDDLAASRRELARRLFLGLVHVAADTADTRRRVVTAELFSGLDDDEAAELEDVLDRFVAQRLITVDTDVVQISHEVLLTAWPRLRSWLDDDRAGLVISRTLGEAAANWHREHRDAAALYRGTRLATARELADSAAFTTLMSPLAKEFLDASVEQELAEQAVARRRSRALRRLVASLVVMLLLTVTAIVVTVRNLEISRAQRNTAISGKVANEATALRDSNPALAAQLSLAAYRLTPTLEARGSLLSTFATPFATRLEGHTGAAYAAEFSPDQRTLVTAAADHTVRLWDVTDRHRPTQLSVLTGHTGTVFAAVFGPGGTILATAGADATVRLWDVTDPRHPAELSTLSGHSSGVRRVAFHRYGGVLVSASYDKSARLWDISDPRRPTAMATVTGHSGAVSAAVFTPDGRTLATASSDSSVRLWDVGDPRRPALVKVLDGHTDRVLTAAFSPDGRTLATGGFDNVLRLWDVSDPSRATALAAMSGHRNGIVAMAFGADSHTVATGSYDLTARLWDITDPQFGGVPVVLSGHAETVYSVSFSSDGRVLASASRDTTARLWDIGERVLSGHTGPVNSAVVSPDGRLVVANSYKTARLWDVGDPNRHRLLATLAGHSDGVQMAAFSTDGRMLATASLDRTVRLWDLADPNAPTLLGTLVSDAENVYSVAMSPDGRLVVTGDADYGVRLWDITDLGHPRPPIVLTGHTDRVLTVAFSPDGRTVASGGSDRVVRLWDVADPRLPRALTVLTGHENAVAGVRFSPDGHTLATAGHDRTARLWDVHDLAHPTLLSTLTGHSDAVNSVAFSPDGQTLATAGSDRTARTWTIADARHPGPPVVLTGHGDWVNSVGFGPDGRTIITAGNDATVRLWDLDVERSAAEVCAVAHPAITPAEWSLHLPDLPYTPPCPD